MICPCGKFSMRCVDSRPTTGGQTRRRYKCACGKRQSTIEIAIDDTQRGTEVMALLRGHGLLGQIIAICEAEIASPAYSYQTSTTTPVPRAETLTNG